MSSNLNLYYFFLPFPELTTSSDWHSSDDSETFCFLLEFLNVKNFKNDFKTQHKTVGTWRPGLVDHWFKGLLQRNVGQINWIIISGFSFISCYYYVIYCIIFFEFLLNEVVHQHTLIRGFLRWLTHISSLQNKTFLLGVNKKNTKLKMIFFCHQLERH